MFRRIVLIKPEGPEALAAIDATLETIPPLVDSVGVLAGAGYSSSIGDRSQGHERCLELTFRTAEDMAAWADAPEHGPIRDTFMANATMIVFDLEE